MRRNVIYEWPFVTGFKVIFPDPTQPLTYASSNQYSRCLHTKFIIWKIVFVMNIAEIVYYN